MLAALLLLCLLLVLLQLPSYSYSAENGSGGRNIVLEEALLGDGTLGPQRCSM